MGFLRVLQMEEVPDLLPLAKRSFDDLLENAFLWECSNINFRCLSVPLLHRHRFRFFQKPSFSYTQK